LSGEIPSSLGGLTNLTQLLLHYNQLSGPIPASLGNLTYLRTLFVQNNQLSGEIPSSLRNLELLTYFYLHSNAGINGTFTPHCITDMTEGDVVADANTHLIICGCQAKITPPTVLPDPSCPDACLASGNASAVTLEKRILTFSKVIGEYQYTCHTDINNNPYADCLNTIAKICNSTASINKTLCQTGVDQMVGQMSPWWQKVRRECGQWRWIDQFIGSNTSSRCATANSDLIANAYYTVWNPETWLDDIFKVTSALTDSVQKGLWSNAALWG